MKKLVLVAILGTSVLTSQAQDSKPAAGKMILAGSLGFATSTPESAKNAPDADATSTITFSPSFGYFLKDNIALGARLSVQTQMMKDMEGGTAWGIGAFGRYYKPMNDAGNFQMFLEAALGYQSSTPLYPKGTTVSPDPATSFGIGVAPGFGWYPGKKWGIEFALPSILGFQSSKSNKDATAATNFQIGVSTLAQPVSFTVLYFIN